MGNKENYTFPNLVTWNVRDKEMNEVVSVFHFRSLENVLISWDKWFESSFGMAEKCNVTKLKTQLTWRPE